MFRSILGRFGLIRLLAFATAAFVCAVVLLTALAYGRVRSAPIVPDMARFVETFDVSGKTPTKIRSSCNRLNLGCWGPSSFYVHNVQTSPLFPPWRKLEVVSDGRWQCDQDSRKIRTDSYLPTGTSRSVWIDQLWGVFWVGVGTCERNPQGQWIGYFGPYHQMSNFSPESQL